MQQVINFCRKTIRFSFWCREKKERLDVWKKHIQMFIALLENKAQRAIDLMAHLDLMISMDSANAHMAANTGVRVLTLWGMTHPFCGFSSISL